MAQVEIRQRLAEEPGLRVTELADRQKLAINTVSNVIQRMVLAGLVDRRVDPNDRRAVTVHLTDTGQLQLPGWLQANGRRLDAAFGDLAEKDRTAILQTLPTLGRLIERNASKDWTTPNSRPNRTTSPYDRPPYPAVIVIAVGPCGLRHMVPRNVRRGA